MVTLDGTAILAVLSPIAEESQQIGANEYRKEEDYQTNKLDPALGCFGRARNRPGRQS